MLSTVWKTSTSAGSYFTRLGSRFSDTFGETVFRGSALRLAELRRMLDAPATGWLRFAELRVVSIAS